MILSPLLSWLAALICLIASALETSPELDERNGGWVSAGWDVRIAWDTAAFTSHVGLDGALVLTDDLTRGQFAIVAAETARDCVQRAALEIGTAPGVFFFDLSLADRPATDPAATGALFQLTQGGHQQIAYIECRGLNPGASLGNFLEIRIVSPAETWPDTIDRWTAVLTGIETCTCDSGCACDQRTVNIRPGMG